MAHAMHFTAEETGVPCGLQCGGDRVGSEAHPPALGSLALSGEGVGETKEMTRGLALMTRTSRFRYPSNSVPRMAGRAGPFPGHLQLV